MWEVHDGSHQEYTICEVNDDGTCQPLFKNIGPDDKGERGEFVCLAKAAFDVMMRRPFSPVKVEGGQWAVQQDGDLLGSMWIGFTGNCSRNRQGTLLTWPDPFTAIVEAEAWYVANVEKAGQADA